MSSIVGKYLWLYWGNTKERIEVPALDERQRQTSFGALNYYTQEFLIKPDKKGDSSNAIAFGEYLISQAPKSRIALICSGASYHRYVEFKTYLDKINQGLNEPECQVNYIREHFRIKHKL